MPVCVECLCLVFEEISRDFSDEEKPDETVLTINLKERKTGSATFGVAYSRDDGLVGFIEAADDNFFGRGQRVNATMQLGKKLHSYELGFMNLYHQKRHFARAQPLSADLR